MKQSKITFLTSVGAGLEYYDLVIYNLLASFISEQFFPNSNHTAALFATFGVLAAGNIIRPIGGIIFGIFGDRFGRKNVFSNTLLWMAFATFLMGLVPNFASIGLAASIIFGLCRIAQGITFSAELPGAMTFLAEHIGEKRHGIHFGFMVSIVSISASFAAFIIWVLVKILSQEQMLAWGFRLPFLFGGILALIGFIIRKQVPETPIFLATKNLNLNLNTQKISICNKDNIKIIFKTIGILIFPFCFIAFKSVLPVYLHDSYNYSFSDIYSTIAFLLPTGICFKLFFGWISDYTGRKNLLFAAALLFIILVFPFFSLLQLGTRWALFCFYLFDQIIVAAMSVSYFALLPKAFPTNIRYAGTAFSYNVVYALATLIPLVANYVYGVIKEPNYIVVLFILLATVTGISTLLLKKI